MLNEYYLFSKEDIALMKDLLVLLKENGEDYKVESTFEKEILNFAGWHNLYWKHGFKTNEDIICFSKKLCNAGLAIPWYINNSENEFGVNRIERYEVDKIEAFITLWEKSHNDLIKENIKNKIFNGITIIMFVDWLIKIINLLANHQ